MKKQFFQRIRLVAFGLMTVFCAANAADWTAVASGNWNANATWGAGGNPGNGNENDKYIIPAGITVTVTNQISNYGTIEIQGGTLLIGAGGSISTSNQNGNGGNDNAPSETVPNLTKGIIVMSKNGATLNTGGQTAEPYNLIINTDNTDDVVYLRGTTAAKPLRFGNNQNIGGTLIFKKGLLDNTDNFIRCNNNFGLYAEPGSGFATSIDGTCQHVDANAGTFICNGENGGSKIYIRNAISFYNFDAKKSTNWTLNGGDNITILGTFFRSNAGQPTINNGPCVWGPNSNYCSNDNGTGTVNPKGEYSGANVPANLGGVENTAYETPTAINDILLACSGCTDFGAPVLSRGSVSDEAITLNWTTVPDATSYNIYRSLSANVNTGASATPVATVSGENFYTDNDVTVSTTYYYKVVAISENCKGVSNEISETTDPCSTGSLDMYFDLTATPITDCGVSATTITLDGSQAGVTYQLFKGTDPAGVLTSGTGSELTWTDMPVGVYTVTATGDDSFCNVTATLPTSATVTEKAAEAKLIFEELAWEPADAKAGDNIRFKVKVKNIGCAKKEACEGETGAGEAGVAGNNTTKWGIVFKVYNGTTDEAFMWHDYAYPDGLEPGESDWFYVTSGNKGLVNIANNCNPDNTPYLDTDCNKWKAVAGTRRIEVTADGGCTPGNSIPTLNQEVTFIADCVAPTIDVQPSTDAQNIYIGQPATQLSVQATGENLTYQWYSSEDQSNSTAADDILLTGETDAQFTPSTDAEGKNYYYCIVSVTCGHKVKSAVSGKIVVRQQPADCDVVPTDGNVIVAAETVCEGATTTIRLDVSHIGATYTLYCNEVKVEESEYPGNGIELTWTVGANGTYSIKAVGDGETYCATQRTLANVAELTVIESLNITTQPQEAVYRIGDTPETLSVTVAGGSNPSYKWFRGEVPELIEDEVGTNAPTYTPDISAIDTFFYRVEITDDCGGNVTSAVAAVAVTKAPCVNVPLEGTIVVESTMTNTASVCPNATDVIRFNFTPLTGAATLALYCNEVKVPGSERTNVDGYAEWAVTVTETSTYSIKAVGDDDVYCTTEVTLNNTATITVKEMEITTQPQSKLDYKVGDTPIALSVAATGSDNYSYQWLKGESDLSIEEEVGTGAAYTPDISTAGTLYYQVEIIGDCGGISSEIATITVSPVTALDETQADKAAVITGYYDISGKKLPQEPESGIYIIKYDNGTAKKAIK